MHSEKTDEDDLEALMHCSNTETMNRIEENLQSRFSDFRNSQMHEFLGMRQHLLGRCNICGGYSTFFYKSGEISYRESFVCAVCRTNSRYRSIARGILLAIRELVGIQADSIVELSRIIEGAGASLKIYDTQIPFCYDNGSYPIPYLLSKCKWIDVQTSTYMPEKPGGVKLGANITNQNLEQLTFLDNSFDIVITSDVMGHVRLDERAHQEIRRVLKPGGIYLFTVPHFRHQSEPITRVVVTDPLDPSKDQFVMQKEYDAGIPSSRPLSYRSYGTDLDRYLESLGFTVDYSNQDFPEIGIMNTELFFCRLSKTKTRVASSIQTASSEQIIKAVIPKRLKDKRDIVYFPITDWSFRYKRENHLLSKFANNGHRIFHLTVNVYPEKTPYSVTNITDNIFEVKLNCISHFNIYTDVLDEGITESLLLSLQKMQNDLDINALSFITIPTLARLCLALKEKYGWPIIFDCLDNFSGFRTVNKARIDEEIELLRNSDLVLAASSECATQKCTMYTKARVTNKTLYIPNAVEFDHFKQLPQNDLLKNIKKPIAGYYGPMTTDWFDNETVEYLAVNRPNVNFVFIGHTLEEPRSNIATLEKLSNVHFLGEKPYRELPLYLYHFDVCLIPFKLTPTAAHSDYLKFYEYLASGKPVISTMLPPLFPFGNLCYLSSDQEQFLINLDRALNENAPQMVSRRIEFASKNTWQDRFDILYPEVKKLRPARIPSAQRNQNAIEEKDNQISQLHESIKIIDTQLKDAVKDLGVLHNINLGHQKTIEEKDNQISQLKDLNETLQNITLGDQKTIEEKDNQISQLKDLKETLQNANLGDQKIIEEKERTISILQSHNTALGNTLALKNNELLEIKDSVLFGIVRRIAVFIDRMAPPNTTRRDFTRLSRTALVVRRQYGTKVMLHEVKKKIFGEYKQKTQQRSKSKKYSDKALFSELASELERLNRINQDEKILSPEVEKPVEDEYFREFLALGSANISKLREYPLVSIIITTFSNLEDLKKNILGIETKSTYPNYEIIIVTNNCDVDSPMRKYLSSLEPKHKVYVYNGEYSFSGVNNFGASKANGKLLLFLNDDTEVNEPLWLEALVKLAIYPSTGAVGGKALYPDGTLQEAGGIVWRDGSASNYGRYKFGSTDPNVNFVREVDYCSGSFLLVKRSVFDEIGGFDERYSPAYYEDTDLCFAIRDRGLGVQYQPLSTIIHKEGATQGTDTTKGIKAYQPINQKKFFAKWKHKLEGRLESSPENMFIERSQRTGKNILYIDHYVPTPDKDSGSLRTFYILGILSWLGHNITFWPDNLHKNEPYVTELQQKGVEVIYGPNKFENFITERGMNFDIIILSRPHIASQYIDTIQKYAPHCKIVYDTTDLHYLRLGRQAMLEKTPELINYAQKIKEIEMKLIKSSNIAFVVTKKEGSILKDEDSSVNPVILPNIHISPKNILPFEDRQDIAFIAGFQHPPNVDAAIFLTNEIFPLIKENVENIKLFIVGSNPPDQITALASEDVIVTGYVPDISPYLERIKVMVAPIRYGAGLKGKITESMSFGLPVVTTTVGAEGLDMIDGDSILIANSPEEFALKTAKIYANKDLWSKISANSRELAEKRYSPENVLEMFRILFSS